MKPRDWVLLAGITVWTGFFALKLLLERRLHKTKTDAPARRAQGGYIGVFDNPADDYVPVNLGGAKAFLVYGPAANDALALRVLGNL